MQKQNDPLVLDYILAVFPSELQLLAELGESLRQRNLEASDKQPIDIEPILVAEMWMRRVLDRAREGELDVKGVFELSACLANEMPKIQAQREQELVEFRANNQLLRGNIDIDNVAGIGWVARIRFVE